MFKYGRICIVNGKGERNLFSVGEKVVYKTNAVCTVEAVETPSFVKESDKKYYKLRYLFSNGNEVVYVPVDSDVNIRGIMSKKKAEECLEMLKDKPASEFTTRQPALLAAHFQQMLSDNSVEGTAAVLKEILVREKKCTEEGKKLRQTEEHYLAIVEKALSEELAVVLDKDIFEIKGMIRNAVLGE
ncbi:MAG: hypothetical protein E7600_01700 [Ruminococcaceae bacterium]|nr:hypothetical protein [Oscillospiraceae bacterium]